MKINKQCLPCLMNQVVKIAKMTDCLEQDELFHQVFH